MSSFNSAKLPLKRYIPVLPQDIGLKIMESKSYFTSKKYDGYMAILTIRKNEITLHTKNNKPLQVPAIIEAAKKISEEVTLIGELCVFKDDKSLSHREVSAALAEPEKHDLRFGVFDLFTKQEKQPEVIDKINQIKKLATSKEIFAIEQIQSDSRSTIIDFYKQIEGKEEGLVVRTVDGLFYKVKPTVNIDLVILGYALNSGNDEVLRELLLGVVDENNNFQIVSKCGNGFSERDRVDLLKKLKPLAVESSFTEVSGAKTAFVMVEPSLIIELSCLDFITETSKGTIKKPTLSFDKKTGYALTERKYTISCISPVFQRIRDDKKVDFTQVGGQEFEDLLFDSIQSEKTVTSPSTIIVREVYSKSGKNGTAIRKFLGIKTNKEDTGQYAPFVALFSDFSSGRKTPLEQEIFLCSDKKELEAKIAELKEENIKSGWELV
jgi:ATP-dependent DNA ligase